MSNLFRTALLMSAATMAPVAAHAAETTNADVSELVVTAQKREQRLQDVPLAVSAVAASQLRDAGIEGTQDLTRAVPGLIFVKNSAFSMPSIRGIGTKSSAAGDSGSVALYIDGVYLSGQQSGVFDFGYIERVEVLKGPQGTLFGRNATGGAISVVTRTPQSEFFAEGEVGYASYHMRTAKGYVTGGLSDTLKADFQFFYAKDRGYIVNILNGDHLDSANNFGARAKVVWNASDAVTFTGAIDHIEDANSTGYAYFARAGSTSVTRTNPNAILAKKKHTVSPSFTPFQRTQQNGVSLTTDIDLGGVAVKSITAYRFMRNTDWLDQDQTNIPSSALLIRAFTQNYSQEFIATSTGDNSLNWLAGLFLFKEKAGRDPNITYTNGLPGAPTDAIVKTEAYAPYGELTWKITDRLTAIGGLRYSYERKRLINASNKVLRVRAFDEWDNLDYRVTLQYFVSPDLNIYATNNTGFKSGAFNSTSFTNPPVFPETVDAYSAGFKFARNGFVLNADVFWYDWHDIQIQRSVDPLVGTTLLQNAAEGRIKGLEVEFRAPLGRDLSLTAGGTLMDGEYTKFPAADVLLPFTNLQLANNPGGARPCGTPGGTPIGGNCSASIDVSGKPTYRTPKVSANLGLNYRHAFEKGVLGANGSLYYSSKYSWEPNNRVVEKAHTLLNARVSWSPPSEAWKITVWGDNLTDVYYYYNTNTSTGGDTGNPAPPRRFGITFSARTN